MHVSNACRGAALALVALLLGSMGTARADTVADNTTDGCDLHYRVTPRHDRLPRVLEVELTFDAEGRRQTVLRTHDDFGGALNLAAALSGWRGLDAGVSVTPQPRAAAAAASAASAASGPAHPVTWTVAHADQGRVRVAWQVQAALADPDEEKPQPQTELYRPQVGRDWFQFLGYGVLATPEPWGDDRRGRLCITLVQPDAAAGGTPVPLFGSHLSGTGPAVSGRIVDSPARLRHAFYAGGAGWRVSTRQLASGPVHVAVRGRFEVADTDFADRAAQLIDTHRRFWGDRVAPPQWLVLTPNFGRGNLGGTLVTHAALLHVGASFSPRSPGFAFLVGHENLHQWLPVRFGDHAPDPTGYWFSEGFTNFYTHRLLLASGLWSLDDYATGLTRALQQYWRSPARNAPASNLAPRFFSDRDAGQQFYARGEWLALHWDRALRAQGHAGLDAVLRGVLLPQPAEPGSTQASERVLQALQPLLGDRARPWVQAYIERGDDVPLPADLAGPCFELGWSEVPRWSLGFDPASFTDRVLRGVVVDGPAHAAGLRNGQAVAGWSVYNGDTSRDAEVTLMEDGQPRTVRYRPVAGRERLPQLQVRAGAAEAASCRAWVQR